MKHEWGPSKVGHGEFQCIHCLMTNREAWVLGETCLTANGDQMSELKPDDSYKTFCTHEKDPRDLDEEK